MDLRSNKRKSSIKTNSIEEEVNGSKHIKFNEAVIVDTHKEPIHFTESNHRFKEAEAHYQDIVKTTNR